MRPWEELTDAGRYRRMRTLAWRALESWPITVRRLRLVGGFTNVIYRVDADEGTFALRVDLFQDHSAEDNELEMSWLTALRNTDIDAVRPVDASDGSTVVVASAEGVPDARRCVLFEWVPGRPLADHPDVEGYHRLGRLSARLHEHGASVQLPHRPMAWDRVFYWPETFDPIVIFDETNAGLFIGNRREVLDRSIARVERAFAALSAQQVVHGDLHPWNVHRFRQRLIAFDFEDVMWAAPIQDIAISLYYLEGNEGYGDLCEAFREGYERITPWPATTPHQLEHFKAARRISFLNLVINLGDPAGFWDASFPRLERYLDLVG